MGLIVLYCAAIMMIALAGGYVPLALKISHARLQMYLSLSAGAMLGAAFFHMLPEASHLCPDKFGLWMIVGVLGLYMIERFLAPHTHEAGFPQSGSASRKQALAVHDACSAHPSHDQSHEPTVHSPVRGTVGPDVAGWSAVGGLFIHTLLGGAALGGAVIGHESTANLGFAVFLATVLHKPADAFTISMLLMRRGSTRRKVFAVQVAFALMIPLGVVLFAAGESLLPAEVLESRLTGAVLAFSAGTFVCISLSDLLPEVQFHSHDRFKLFALVLLGAAVMWLTAMFEPAHSHHHH